MSAPATQVRRRPSEALADAGLTLPDVAAPLAAYTPAALGSGVWPEVGEDYVIRTSGQLPLVDGQLLAVGKVGAEVTDEQAYACARQAALGAIAAAAALAGGIDNLLAVVRVSVFVASDPAFTGQAQVANGASELLGAVFGQPGLDPRGHAYPKAHTRSAVGVAVLPIDAPVEVEVEFLARKSA